MNRLATISAIVAVAALAGCSTAHRGTYNPYDDSFSLDTLSEDGLPRGERVALTEEQTRAVQEQISFELIDPQSAIFRNVMAGRGAGGPLVVCGYVNSKNRLGGYVGEKIFIATISGEEVLDLDLDEDALTHVTDECRFSGIPINPL